MNADVEAPRSAVDPPLSVAVAPDESFALVANRGETRSPMSASHCIVAESLRG